NHLAKKKAINDYSTGIPQHEMEALARVLLPEIEKFYASEEGQRQFAQWKEEQQLKQQGLSMRLSHNLCKPAERCRIEAADRRYYTWPERTAPRKKTPVERKSENFCRWQTSAA